MTCLCSVSSVSCARKHITTCTACPHDIVGNGGRPKTPTQSSKVLAHSVKICPRYGTQWPGKVQRGRKCRPESARLAKSSEREGIASWRKTIPESTSRLSLMRRTSTKTTTPSTMPCSCEQWNAPSAVQKDLATFYGCLRRMYRKTVRSWVATQRKKRKSEIDGGSSTIRRPQEYQASAHSI